MSKQPFEPQERPLPAQKRNPGMRAHGYEFPPEGPMRHVDEKHLTNQERLGDFLMLAVFLAVGWTMCAPH